MAKTARRSPVAVTRTTFLAQPAALPLPSSPLRDALSPASRDALRALGRDRSFAAGERLFGQGDRHDGIFLIEAGVVRSYYVSEDGRELTLGFWGTGNFVGGPQLFGGGPHAWTSQAQCPTRCVFLPGRPLRALAEARPDLGMALLDALVQKAECYSALLQLLATHSMKVRLARLLAMLAGSDTGGRIRFTHGQLAGMIGSTRQWVSKALELFDQQQLVKKMADGSVQVLRPQALIDLR